LKAVYEDGAIEYVAEVSKDVYDLVKSGEIRHVSVEYDWSILQKLDGVAPKGLEFQGLSFLRGMEPGDPRASVEVWEGVIRKLSEMRRLSEQDSERERLRKEQEERARKYGIEPKPGGNLTKPSEYENIPEEKFADPVNWKYPIDAEHVRGALTYFNQPDNRAEYSHEEQVRIMEKIIRAALENGVEVSYQPGDPVYRDLPPSLKEKLSGYKSEEALRRELEEAEKRIRGLEEERNGLMAKLSVGEAVVDKEAEPSIPLKEHRMFVERVEAVLPKSIPLAWGSAGYEMVRRLRRLCSEAKG
jgi:hypothetical protein